MCKRHNSKQCYLVIIRPIFCPGKLCTPLLPFLYIIGIYISESFKDFQSFVTHNFGPIYDTKLLCKELKHIIPKNGLQNLK